MFRRFLFLGFIAFLFVGATVPQQVSADYVSKTVTLLYDEYLSYPITYSGSGTLTVTASKGSYDSYFDVYFVTPAEFNKYTLEETFRYLPGCSDEDTGGASISCSLDAGKYYLIFDNRWFSGASPYDGESITLTYTIETTDSGGGGGGGDGDPFYSSIICFAIGGVILVIIIIAVVMGMRKKRATISPPPLRTTYRPPPPSPPVQTPHHQGTQQYSSAPHQDYSREPPPPQQPQPQTYSPPPPKKDVYDGPPAPPPSLELPGMMGGTRGTLDETYKGQRKDGQK